jgi:hypothetical protein
MRSIRLSRHFLYCLTPFLILLGGLGAAAGANARLDQDWVDAHAALARKVGPALYSLKLGCTNSGQCLADYFRDGHQRIARVERVGDTWFVVSERVSQPEDWSVDFVDRVGAAGSRSRQ